MPDQPTDAGKDIRDVERAERTWAEAISNRPSGYTDAHFRDWLIVQFAEVRAEGARQERAKTQLACDIAAWQLTADVHPLTCGNASAHRLLVPAVVGDRIVLRCLDCAYQQDHVPDCCFRAREPREEPIR